MRPDGRGAMLMMNHLSWLDIFVVHSIRPAHFIAKSEIARWPLLGYPRRPDRRDLHRARQASRGARREPARRDDADGRRARRHVPRGHGRRRRRDCCRSTRTWSSRRSTPARRSSWPASAIATPGAVRRPRRCTSATSTMFESMRAHRAARSDGRRAAASSTRSTRAATSRHDVGAQARAMIGDGARARRRGAARALEALSTVHRRARTSTRRAALAGTAPGTALDPRDELL